MEAVEGVEVFEPCAEDAGVGAGAVWIGADCAWVDGVEAGGADTVWARRGAATSKMSKSQR